MFGVKNEFTFALRGLMKDHPGKLVLIFLSLGVCLFGWLVMIAEMPINRINMSMDKTALDNTIWMSIVTMTTVGYGDIYPVTW